MALIEVKLRPTGPWRAGHGTGDRERVDVIYHSDALYSALTHAMRALGWLEPWLDATARNLCPVVRFSSLYPFVGKTRLIAPPRGTARPFAVKLAPLELARGGAFDKTRWQADVPSQCLIPHGSHAPFQVSVRSASAVDRITGTGAEPHRVACLEFASNAGWWGVFDVTDSDWEAKIKAAFRLLADSGFGGERSRGWGRASEPTFSTATALFPDRTPNGEWWVLGLFSPAAEDRIDWAKSAPAVAERGGWTDSPQGSGAKKLVRMIEEGSVLVAESLTGRAVDVAPDGFPHPVYRNGQALAVPLPAAAPAVAEIVAAAAAEVPATEPEAATVQFEPNSEPAVETEPAAADAPPAADEAVVQFEANPEPGIEAEPAAADTPPAADEAVVRFEPNPEPAVETEPVAADTPSAAVGAVVQFEPNPEPVVETEPVAADAPPAADEAPVQFEPNPEPAVETEPVAADAPAVADEAPVQFEPNSEPDAVEPESAATVTSAEPNPEPVVEPQPVSPSSVPEVAE